MLTVIKSYHQLDLSQLFRVYQQSIQAAAAENYRRCATNEGILNAQQDFYGYLRDFLSDTDTMYALWTVDGVYKAALRLEPYLDGLLLSGLETAPDARCCGFASALMKATLEYVGGHSGDTVYSHVNKENAISLAVHAKCGFRRLSDFANYIDGSVALSACTLIFDDYKK